MSVSSNAKPQSGLDSLKWLVVVVLIGVAVGGNIYFDDQSLLYRVLGILAVSLVAAFVAIQTTQGANFWRLAKEARTEIRKVVWPTRQESTQTTLIVVLFVIVSAILLWLMDLGLGWLASLVIG